MVELIVFYVVVGISFYIGIGLLALGLLALISKRFYKFEHRMLTFPKNGLYLLLKWPEFFFSYGILAYFDFVYWIDRKTRRNERT